MFNKRVIRVLIIVLVLTWTFSVIYAASQCSETVCENSSEVQGSVYYIESSDMNDDYCSVSPTGFIDDYISGLLDIC